MLLRPLLLPLRQAARWQGGAPQPRARKPLQAWAPRLLPHHSCCRPPHRCCRCCKSGGSAHWRRLLGCWAHALLRNCTRESACRIVVGWMPSHHDRRCCCRHRCCRCRRCSSRCCRPGLLPRMSAPAVVAARRCRQSPPAALWTPSPAGCQPPLPRRAPPPAPAAPAAAESAAAPAGTAAQSCPPWPRAAGGAGPPGARLSGRGGGAAAAPGWCPRQGAGPDPAALARIEDA